MNAAPLWANLSLCIAIAILGVAIVVAIAGVTVLTLAAVLRIWPHFGSRSRHWADRRKTKPVTAKQLAHQAVQSALTASMANGEHWEKDLSEAVWYLAQAVSEMCKAETEAS